jgi:hypothetical protein
VIEPTPAMVEAAARARVDLEATDYPQDHLDAARDSLVAALRVHAEGEESRVETVAQALIRMGLVHDDEHMAEDYAEGILAALDASRSGASPTDNG